MKTVKINVNKAVEDAFYSGHLGKELQTWLFGEISIIGCYHPEDYSNPYHYLVLVEHNNTKHYFGLFDKNETFTENDFNRTFAENDYLWWNNKVFLLMRIKLGPHNIGTKIVELYSICDGNKLSQAFPAGGVNKDNRRPIKFLSVRSVDGKKNFGYYWDIPYRDLIPFSPITQEPIKRNAVLYQTEEIPIFEEGFIGFYRFGIDWEYRKNNDDYPRLVGDPYKYKKDNLAIYFSETLKRIAEKIDINLEDTDWNKSFHSLGLGKEEVIELMKKLDFQYDIDFNIEGTDFSTPQKLQDFVCECLDDRIFG